jgi:hypothetical protein
MSKPICFDLCCGCGGWTRGFLAAGFEVYGFDIAKFQEYPVHRARFMRRDVMDLTPTNLLGADFIIASTPCEEFSVWGMKHFHPDPPFPIIGLTLFQHVRRICQASGVPYVMENVRSAQQFVGPAQGRAGSFYLWGNSVPLVLPLTQFHKGMSHMSADGRFARPSGVDKFRNQSKKIRSAAAAIIPFELAYFVASVAREVVRQRSLAK